MGVIQMRQQNYRASASNLARAMNLDPGYTDAAFNLKLAEAEATRARHLGRAQRHLQSPPPQRAGFAELPAEGLPVVAILAHKRGQELEMVLGSLRGSPGGEKGRIIVFQDGNDAGVKRAAAIYRAELVLLDSECYRYRIGRGGNASDEGKCVKNVYGEDATGNRVCHNYWNMLGLLFALDSGVDAAVILEEDLLPSHDAWGYFATGARLMQRDRSVFTVSAWHTMGHTPFARDETATLRDRRWMPLGWLATREVYEAVVSTPTCWRLDSTGKAPSLWWWDEPWYCAQHKLGKDTVYPEVPRVHHLFFAPGRTTT